MLTLFVYGSQVRSHSILFYHILSCPIVFYFILSYTILSCSSLFYPILSYPILLHCITPYSHSILSNSLSFSFYSYSFFSSYTILFVIHSIFYSSLMWILFNTYFVPFISVFIFFQYFLFELSFYIIFSHIFFKSMKFLLLSPYLLHYPCIMFLAFISSLHLFLLSNSIQSNPNVTHRCWLQYGRVCGWRNYQASVRVIQEATQHSKISARLASHPFIHSFIVYFDYCWSQAVLYCEHPFLPVRTFTVLTVNHPILYTVRCVQ